MFRSPAPLLQARSLAIVGASDRARWPVSIHRNLIECKYKGKIFPINPGRSEVWGMKCYPDFAALPEAPDLALMIIPAGAMLGALEDGVRHGLKSALIYASGIGEGDDAEFRARGEAVRQLCEDSGLVACGPNCMGTVSVRERLLLYPNPDFNHLPPGPVGAIFQSGGSLQHWCRTAAERGLRFSYAVSSGNELSLDAADYINFMVDDPNTRLIVLMCEGIRRPDAFKEAARRALAAKKPILVVKVGRTEASKRAARSHTGAIAGDFEAFGALCERYGIVLCPNFDDMIETALAFQPGRLPAGDGMAFITNSGGVVDLLYDYADEAGAKLPNYSPATVKAVRKFVGPDMPMRNPMDCGQAGFADADNYMRVCQAVANDPRIHMLSFEARPPNAPDQRRPEPYRKLAEVAPIPVFAFNRMGYQLSEYGQSFQADTGLTFLQSMPETIRAMKALAFYGKRAGKRIPRTPKPKGTKAGKESATAGAGLERALKAHRVTPPKSALAPSATAAVAAARRIGFPVALKVISPQFSHKTEIGGVVLGLDSGAQVREAATGLAKAVRKADRRAAIEGFLVQEMVAGVEVIIGARDDPLYGPMIVVGAGGILVELVKDTAFRLLPITTADARAMIAELRIARLLGGFRGQPASDTRALVNAVVGLGRYFLDHRSWLAEIEINPLIVRAGAKGVRAVDIRPVFRET
jgi:acetyltransferase